MPQPQQVEMRKLLRTYANSVVGPEWDGQDGDEPSAIARGAINDMYRALGNQQTESSPVAVLLGLLLFIIFVLDHPFGTHVGVTSEPFQHSLEVFDAVDRGT